jgi:hypothetical protein
MVEENFPRYERPWYFLMSVKVPRQPDAFDYLTDEDIERLEQYAQNLIEDRHEEVRAAKQRLSSPLRPIDDVDLPACGDPDCQHAPDGGNHPVNPS